QYAKDKTAAQEALKRPDQFQNNADERVRLEQLVKSPPDHVVGATFASAALHSEAGRFAEAQARFGDFAKQSPDSPPAPEALLHLDYCQVQLKQFQEAINPRGPLAKKYPAPADQALLWLDKAQSLHSEPNNAQARTNAVNTAINTPNQAAD